jgi:hypothetical protein
MADRRRKRRPPQRVLVALELLAPYTAEYLSVLRAALPGLEALTRLDGADVEPEQLAAVAECVRAAVEGDGVPGTPRAIAVLLERAFGTLQARQTDVRQWRNGETRRS